jgi:hypothetical protein
VAEHGHALIREDGAPFFWLGDTAWELFHRLNREEATQYLQNRAEKRFTVIQAVVLAEFDGLRTPNVYGEIPLIDNDPMKPNEAYFAYVDEIVDMAAELGLYIGLLPTWGDKVMHMWGAGPHVFNPENAYVYGKFLGERYGPRSNILWVLGGDRPAIKGEEDARPIWRAMARGIDEATGGNAFMTYHPMGGASSSTQLHDEEWLDMNMMQSGHGSGRDVAVWDMITADYEREPAKPTLDGEPNYEDHPVNPWPTWDPANGYFRDHDVRKQCYRSVLAGGCGVTYGHHSIWQFYDPAKRELVNHADRSWQEALDRPGAQHMTHLRALFEARPPLNLVPAQELLLTPTGSGDQHVCAARARDGRYAIVYLPTSQTVSVQLDGIGSGEVHASWYDPRTGATTEGGTYRPFGEQAFAPPADGPDWVLILDAAGQR